MVGNLTFDKASMNISYFLFSVKIIYDNGGSMTRTEFVQKMAEFIGLPAERNGKENRTPYNKSKLPRYYGFIDISTSDTSMGDLVLTKRGLELVNYISEKTETDINADSKFYISNNHRENFVKLFIGSIMFDSFGKNNCGAEQSNTDIEPPKIVLKTISILGRATAEEICYIIFSLNKSIYASYDEALFAVIENRKHFNYNYEKIMDDWGVTNIVNDCKIINIFTDSSIGLLNSEKDEDVGKLFYSFNSHMKQYSDALKMLDAVYQPLQMIIYSKSIQTARTWLNESILGRVSSDNSIFNFDNSAANIGDKFLGYKKDDIYKPGILASALKYAYNHEKTNTFLIIENLRESQLDSLFGSYLKLLVRHNDFRDKNHGKSSESIIDNDLFQYIFGKNQFLRAGEVGSIIFPSNFHIIGITKAEAKDMNNEYNYRFKRSLVEINEKDIIESKSTSMREVKDLKTKIIEIYEQEKFSEIDVDIKSLYDEFNTFFGPDALASLDGIELLKTMFYSEEKNEDNMCYYLEYHKKSKEYFGSVSPGSSYAYGLYYNKEQNSWMTGSSRNPQKLTEEEAIEKGKTIRDALLKGADFIKEYGSVTTADEYALLDKKLNEKVGSIANNLWVQKFYHMLFPKMFSTFYSEDWQKHILLNCGLMPLDGRYSRSGQISMFVNKIGISNAAFGKIAYKLFGGLKQFYRLGTSVDGANWFNDWHDNGYAAIGWMGLGNLNDYLNDKSIIEKDSILEKMQELYYPDNKRLASRKSGEICDFYNAKASDSYYVAMDGQKLLAIGVINSDYYYDDKLTLGHCKKVKWIYVFTKGEKLPEMEGNQTTCYPINNDKNLHYLFNILNNIEFLDNGIQEEETKMLPTRLPRNQKMHSLNVILYGAPGTGKTYSTAEYAVAIAENRPINTKKLKKEERAALLGKYEDLVKQNRIIFTTFHQSYGYEDFIQGLRPDTKSDTMKFVPIDGIFKKLSQEAMKNDGDYIIIIDEINRGNISKIFGELITLIEEDKRWGEENQMSVILPSGEEFAVPNNLYIIGTMNSADKSISLIDTALRRRFEFIEQTPDSAMIDDITLKKVFEKLNQGLIDKLETTDLLIGHAYFMGKTMDDLSNIMNRNIIPLLYEYFYDNSKLVKNIVEKAIEDLDYKVSDVKSGRLKVVPKE